MSASVGLGVVGLLIGINGNREIGSEQFWVHLEPDL